MVGQQTLDLFILVRIQARQHNIFNKFSLKNSRKMDKNGLTMSGFELLASI